VIISLASEKRLACSHAIFGVRKITKRFIKAGYTANVSIGQKHLTRLITAVFKVDE